MADARRGCLLVSATFLKEISRRYADGSRDSVPQLLVFEKMSNESVLAKDIQIRAD